MAQLADRINIIKGIGEKRALSFNRLGVFTLYDLISFFPRKYEDHQLTKKIALTCSGESVCVAAVVADEPRLIRIRRGMELVKFRIADETGVIDVTYFNQSYMKNNLVRGNEYVFFGRIDADSGRRSMINPVFEKASQAGGITGRIFPVYKLTAGLNQKTVMQSVRAGLDFCGEFIPEILPESVILRRNLARAAFSYENVHFPSDFESLEIARRRLVFEELFVLAAALGRINCRRRAVPGIRLGDGTDYRELLSEFYASLPFSPTSAQKRAVDDAAADISSGNMMNRLVQGDVGSGKTLVAAALCYLVFKYGGASAFMAPTEILAGQHFRTLSSLLSPFGMRIALLTGSMTVREKRLVKEQLKNGETDLVIGTHALISEDVEIKNLSLVITDEQHRFGVDQRALLSSKGDSPHVLVMSATPIPRTLALIIYGDLDVSVLDELPPGRQAVETFAVDERYRERLERFILKQHDNGNQTFIVCPMVEENEETAPGLKSAEEHARELQKKLPQLKIACVHGRMKPGEKDLVMQSFVSGETDVLVSTTVIEVGVDVPNATLMIIENAERFGLSQLHQLRGRVGRGKAKSYCVLVSSCEDEASKARLAIMCKTNDGFRISEEDLRLRGPGDFFGSRQHGLPEMHVADLGTDITTLKAAQEEAAAVLADDPELEKPENSELRKRIDALFSTNMTRFN